MMHSKLDSFGKAYLHMCGCRSNLSDRVATWVSSSRVVSAVWPEVRGERTGASSEGRELIARAALGGTVASS